MRKLGAYLDIALPCPDRQPFLKQLPERERDISLGGIRVRSSRVLWDVEAWNAQSASRAYNCNEPLKDGIGLFSLAVSRDGLVSDRVDPTIYFAPIIKGEYDANI